MQRVPGSPAPMAKGKSYNAAAIADSEELPSLWRRSCCSIGVGKPCVPRTPTRMPFLAYGGGLVPIAGLEPAKPTACKTVALPTELNRYKIEPLDLILQIRTSCTIRGSSEPYVNSRNVLRAGYKVHHLRALWSFPLPTISTFRLTYGNLRGQH